MKSTPFWTAGSYEYRLEIRFDSDTRQASVAVERLKVSSVTVFELADGEIHFFSNNGAHPAAVPLRTTRSALYLSLLSNRNVQRFAEWMETVHCIRIDAYPDQMDESSDREEREPDDELANLAGWYRYNLQTWPDEHVRFVACLKEALGGFQALRFLSDEDGTRRLRVDFSGPQRERVHYSLAELSEGQRCLIALYMLLSFSLVRGHTLFIDKPDNYVALREIQPWLLAAEEVVEDFGGQLILVSHHPELLNQWARTSGLRFFREENGHVRTENFRPDPNGQLLPSELIARGLENE